MGTGTTADDTQNSVFASASKDENEASFKAAAARCDNLVGAPKDSCMADAWQMHGRCKGQIPSETGAHRSCQAKLSFHLYDPVDRMRKYQIFNFSAAAHGAASGQR